MILAYIKGQHWNLLSLILAADQTTAAAQVLTIPPSTSFQETKKDIEGEVKKMEKSQKEEDVEWSQCGRHNCPVS